MKRFLSHVLAWAVVVGLTIGGLEIGLRLYPEAIPLGVLKLFNKQVRLEVAKARMLRNESQLQIVPRDDGGPLLRVFKPNARIRFDFGSATEQGALELDGQGFCNPAGADGRGDVEIIALGDSFTQCLFTAPQKTWPGQLSSISDRSVYNVSYGGIGPYEYLQLLKRFGLSRSPRVVVLNIYESSDLCDSVIYHEYVAATASGDAAEYVADEGRKRWRRVLSG